MDKVIAVLKKIKVVLTSFFIKVFNAIKNVISKIVTNIKNKKMDIKEVLEKTDKKIKTIEISYPNEYSKNILNTYIKQLKKKVNKLSDNKIAKTREEEKLLQKKIKQINSLIDKIDKYKNSLEEPIVKEQVSFKQKSVNFASKTKTTSKQAIGAINKTTTNFINSKFVLTIKMAIIKFFKMLVKLLITLFKLIVGFISKVIINIKEFIKRKKKKRKEKKLLIKNVKYLNRKINFSYEKISKIKNTNSSTRLEELLFLKEKIIDLQDNYIKFTKMKGFSNLRKSKKVNSIDPNHLVHHDKAINDLLGYLENSIDETSKQKEAVEQPIKEEVKPVKKEFVIDPNQLLLIKNSIKKDVANSIKEIKKIRKEVDDIPYKYQKDALLSRLSNFFKFSIKTAITLIPFGVFKNKLYATLTSGIILNNKIRSIQSITKKTNVAFVNYEALLNSITDKMSCLSNINYILDDTVTRIDSINKDLLQNYNESAESLSLIKNLEEMKIDLLDENNKIIEMIDEEKEERKKK